MNILVFGNGSLSIAQQERKLAIEFVNAGHKVFLVCNQQLSLFDVGDLPENPNLEIIDMPYNQYRFDLLPINDKIDVCFGMDQSVVPFVAEYKSRFHIPSFCMFLDFPVHVLDGNDRINYNFNYSQRYYYWLQCSLEIDSLIFNNTVAVEEYFARYKRMAKLVFYAVSEDDYLSKVTNTPTKDFAVGCNRIIPYKGTDYALQALRRTEIPYRHIYVSGDQKSIEIVKALAKENKDTRFYTKVSEYEKMGMLYNAKIVIYPQITEWVGGMSILEGYSVKTPGVCFDYPVLRELYDDCGIYAKPKDYLDLRQKIKLLYEDSDMNDDLAHRGYERFKKLFTRKVMAENLLKIFDEYTSHY